MKNNSIKTIIYFLPLFLGIQLFAQERIFIHSHNDYEQNVPFYQAYLQGVVSIEADIYVQDDGSLLVAHDKHELPTAYTIDELYIQPLVRLFARNNNRPWPSSDNTLTLLVDLKTPFSPTLERLIEKLEKYPEVFDTQKNPYAVRVVISGNRPPAKDFYKYSKIVNFDGDRFDYTPQELERISMISLSLASKIKWDGKTPLKEADYKIVTELVRQAHRLGKPIRFWATPDGANAWSMLHNMGVDYINTDQPEACTAFFKNIQE